MSCDICLIDHLGRRIWQWHSLLSLAWGKVNARSNEVKLGQIFKLKNSNKVCLCCSVLSQDTKKYYLLCRTTSRHAKNAFKNDVITFTLFYHCAAKNKDIVLKFGMRVVCMTTYIPVCTITPKFCILKTHFCKIKILSFGKNRKTSKTEPPCWAFSFTSFGVFGMHFLSNLYIL